ncbi:MAG: ABC transporter ATP-binding protein [Actinomycetota bacterium]|nr:ABC transporter ATP-binding protein [Actinomycetota bacterium]
MVVDDVADSNLGETPIITATGVVKSFGGLRAVDVEKLEIRRNKITALIGPNGAGKTTFFNLLTGFDQVDQGEIMFDGGNITGTPPHRLAAKGMVRTFQLTKALAKLSTLENMKLGALDQRGEKFWSALIPGLWAKQERDITARAEAILERFNLTHMRDEYAGTMSGGQRKLLEMARALMTNPRIVMLDEPMAGVNPALAQSLLKLIKALPGEGRTVIFVEHNMDVVKEIADWVVVMAEGRIIAQGTPTEIRKNKAVVDAYLGAHHGEDLSRVELA